MTTVLLVLTGPLAYVPRAALAAIVVSSALGLFEDGDVYGAEPEEESGRFPGS